MSPRERQHEALWALAMAAKAGQEPRQAGRYLGHAETCALLALAAPLAQPTQTGVKSVQETTTDDGTIGLLLSGSASRFGAVLSGSASVIPAGRVHRRVRATCSMRWRAACITSFAVPVLIIALFLLCDNLLRRDFASQRG
jgi:hypothetical protein